MDAKLQDWPLHVHETDELLYKDHCTVEQARETVAYLREGLCRQADRLRALLRENNHLRARLSLSVASSAPPPSFVHDDDDHDGIARPRTMQMIDAATAHNTKPVIAEDTEDEITQLLVPKPLLSSASSIYRVNASAVSARCPSSPPPHAVSATMSSSPVDVRSGETDTLEQGGASDDSGNSKKVSDLTGVEVRLREAAGGEGGGLRVEESGGGSRRNSIPASVQELEQEYVSASQQKQDKKAVFRAKIQAELLSTEKSYVKSLNLLIQVFVVPLKCHAEEDLGLSPAVLAALLSNIESLTSFHMALYGELAALKRRPSTVTSSSFPSASSPPSSSSYSSSSSSSLAAPIPSCVPQIMVPTGYEDDFPPPLALSSSSSSSSSSVAVTATTHNSAAAVLLKYADFFKMYSQYLNGYELFLETMTKLRNNKAFQAFLLNVGVELREHRGLDLMAYVIMPVQRVPRYVMLLKELKKYTDVKDPEFAILARALEKVSSVASHINECKRSVETMSKLAVIQQRLTGKDLPSILVPHRSLLREDKFEQLKMHWFRGAYSAEATFLLFSDILLWTSHDSLSYQGHICLNAASVSQTAEEQAEGIFTLQGPSGEGAKATTNMLSVTVQCSGLSSEAKRGFCDAYIHDLREAIRVCQAVMEDKRERRRSVLRRSSSILAPSASAFLSPPPAISRSSTWSAADLSSSSSSYCTQQNNSALATIPHSSDEMRPAGTCRDEGRNCEEEKEGFGHCSGLANDITKNNDAGDAVAVQEEESKKPRQIFGAEGTDSLLTDLLNEDLERTLRLEGGHALRKMMKKEAESATSELAALHVKRQQLALQVAKQGPMHDAEADSSSSDEEEL